MSRSTVVRIALALLIAITLGCNEYKGAEKQVTISNGQPKPWNLRVHRRGEGGYPDLVVWKNDDDVAHTIRFRASSTPFAEFGSSVTIPAKGMSRRFIVAAGAPNGVHFYEINPFFQPAETDSGPGPAVVVEE